MNDPFGAVEGPSGLLRGAVPKRTEWRRRSFGRAERMGLRRDEIAFAAFGGWDAAGAKSFGYPTFWGNWKFSFAMRHFFSPVLG